MKTKKKKYEVDDTDRKIIKLLLENSRLPTTKIAKKLNISHDSVNYRIKNMVKEEIIEKFTIIPDHESLGFNVLGDLAISLWNMTEDDFNIFTKYIKQHPFIISAWSFSGRWDYFIEIYARDLTHFNEIVSEIKIKFSKIIKDTETLFVTKEIKFGLIPEIFQ